MWCYGNLFRPVVRQTYRDGKSETSGVVRIVRTRSIRKPVYHNASYAHYPWLKNALLARPVIEESRCTHCGACVKACPVPDKAVRFNGDGRGRPPEYDYDLCIRCYCCHEMCPNRAIHKHTPVLGRVLHLAA